MWFPGNELVSCLLCTEFVSSEYFFPPITLWIPFVFQIPAYLSPSSKPPRPLSACTSSSSAFSVVFMLLLLLRVQSNLTLWPHEPQRQSLYLHWKSASAKQGASVLFILYHWLLVRMNAITSLVQVRNSHVLASVVCLRLFTQPMSRSEFGSR